MENENFTNQQMVSEKSKGVAAVLCFFLGGLEIHRFYVGKIGTGIMVSHLGILRHRYVD